MSFTRADALTYVTNSFAELISDVGLGLTDTAGAMKEVLDDALLLHGVDYDDLASPTIANADILGLRAILTYTLLNRCYNAALHRVDITLDGPNMSKRRSQMVAQLKDRVAAAKEAAEEFFSDDGSFSLTTMDLDFLEPPEV